MRSAKEPGGAREHVTPEAEADFRFLVERVAASGPKLVPSLVDFHWCKQGQPTNVPGFVKQGRYDVLNDPGKRGPFLDRVLGRLLAISREHADAFYAWEIINEPEWVTRRSGLGDERSPDKTVAFENMQAFIREGIGRINAAGFRSTVGFASHDSLAVFDSVALGATIHQFYYYATPRSVPGNTYDPRWPLICGEFASAAHRPWAELSQQDMYTRLRHLESKGYPAAFIWCADPRPDPQTPPSTDWSPAAQAVVRRFTSGE